MITFRYIPHKKISSLDSKDKIRTILETIKDDHILIIEGRLKSTEEAELIRATMNILSEDVETFNGIEIGTFYDTEEKDLVKRIKSSIAKFLVGDKSGLTIIGPANIVKELRQHPEHIEMHFQKSFMNKNIKERSK